MEQNARAQLADEKIAEKDIDIQWTADLRYAGQAYELNIPMTHNGRLTCKDIDAMVTRFHATHQRVYAYSSKEEPVDLINVRLVGIGQVPAVKLPRLKRTISSPRAAPKGKRPVYYEGSGFVNAPIYERDVLRPGNVVQGPCIIEETISSTVMVPGATAKVDAWGNIIILL